MTRFSTVPVLNQLYRSWAEEELKLLAEYPVGNYSLQTDRHILERVPNKLRLMTKICQTNKSLNWKGSSWCTSCCVFILYKEIYTFLLFLVIYVNVLINCTEISNHTHEDNHIKISIIKPYTVLTKLSLKLKMFQQFLHLFFSEPHIMKCEDKSFIPNGNFIQKDIHAIFQAWDIFSHLKLFVTLKEIGVYSAVHKGMIF